jgi:hypothetical protein
MGAVVVVLGKVRLQLDKDLLAVVGGVQIETFVLDAPPQAFDEGIVGGAPFSIPTDAALGVLQRADKLGTGELTALIGIENQGLL